MGKAIVVEVGRTVRWAICSWPRTVRLCLLVLVVAGILLAYFKVN